VSTDECTDDPHLHQLRRCVIVIEGTALLFDQEIVALFPTSARHIADRCVALLDRYGLIDVPDTPPSPWPAPDGRTWHGKTL
jgi:hypothetical protein